MSALLDTEIPMQTKMLFHGGCWEKPLMPGMDPYLKLDLPEEGIQAVFLSDITQVSQFFAYDRNPDQALYRSVIFKAEVKAEHVLVLQYDPVMPYATISGQEYLLSNGYEAREALYAAAKEAGYQAVEILDHYHFNESGKQVAGSDFAVFDSGLISVSEISLAQPGGEWTPFMPVDKALDEFNQWADSSDLDDFYMSPESHEYADFSINY